MPQELTESDFAFLDAPAQPKKELTEADFSFLDEPPEEATPPPTKPYASFKTFPKPNYGTIRTFARPEGTETSAVGTAAREAGAGVLPSAAFVPGFAMGAEALAPTAPFTLGLGPLVGGLVTGGATAYLASKAQEKAAEALAPEKAKEFEQLLAKGREEHPVAAAGGRLAGALPSFEVALPKTLAEVGPRIAAGVGLSALPALQQGRAPTPEEAAESAAFMLLYGQPRIGAFRGKPTSVQEAMPQEPISTPDQEQLAEMADALAGKSPVPYRIPGAESAPVVQAPETKPSPKAKPAAKAKGLQITGPILQEPPVETGTIAGTGLPPQEAAPSGLEMARQLSERGQGGIPATPGMLEMLPPGSVEELSINELLREPFDRGKARAHVEELGQQIRRAQDFEKARSESIKQSQEDAAKTLLHPDKPLTDNQLRIIEASLKKSILENQGKESRRGIISGSALEKWADGVMGKSPGRLSINPVDILGKQIPALAIKGAALLERGILKFAEWSNEMIKEHGEHIRPLLGKIYAQSMYLKGGEKPGASSKQKTAEVYGDVRAQPGAGVRGVPIEEGSQRVQPQTQGRVQEEAPPEQRATVDDLTRKAGEPSEKAQRKEEALRETVAQPGAATAEAAPGVPPLRPALMIDGKPEIGAVGDSHKAIQDRVKENPDRAESAIEAFLDDAKHVFVDPEGNILNRSDAAKRFDQLKGNPEGTTKELHSHNLEEPPTATKPGVPPERAASEAKSPVSEPITRSGMAVGIAPPGTELAQRIIEWTKTLPAKLAGKSAPLTSIASEASGNALVRFASARTAAPLIEKVTGAKIDVNKFEAQARNELYDQLIKDGLAIEQSSNLPAPSLAGKSTAPIRQRGRKTIWIRKDLESELRQAEDRRGVITHAGLAEVASFINKIQLAGLTDAVWHVSNMVASIAGSQGGKNVLTDLARKLPGVNIADALGRITASGIKVLRDDPAIQKQLADITRIGGGREVIGHGPFGRALALIDRAGRLVRDDMYKNLVDRGLVKANEATRREWINQLGNYNPRLMGQFQRFFKEAGFSPFIVAGRNFNRMAARRITLDPGIKAANPAAYWEMKGIEAMGIMATLVAVPSLINLATTGNPSGRPGIKFGQIDTGKDDANGKHIVIDPAQWTGLRRGLRISGAQAVIEGVRRGEPTERIKRQAITDILGGIIHPWAGPAVSAPVIGVTGHTPSLYKESTNPKDYGENVIAALKQLNPLAAAAITGYETKEGPAKYTAPFTSIAKSLGGAAGFKQVAPYTAQQEMYNLAHNWMKNSGDPKLLKKFEKDLNTDFGQSDYGPLRTALRANDTAKAKKEIDKLLESNSDKAVAKAMKEGAKRGFAGSKENERRFIQSLTDEQYKKYERAKTERLSEYQAFLDVWRK